MTNEQTPAATSEPPKKKRLRIDPFPVLGTKPEDAPEPAPEAEHSAADEADDIGPPIDADALAAAASAPKTMPGTSPVEDDHPTTKSIPVAEPLGVPRKGTSRLRHHAEEDGMTLGPLELRDGLPPPTAVVVPYGRGIKAETSPRHRPASYDASPTTAPVIPQPAAGVVEMRMAQARPEPPPSKRGDPDTNAIHDALAHLGPPERVVDVVVEVFDEVMNQYWTIGGATAQPLSVIREPHRYLKFGGYYRISVCNTGEGFDKRKTTSFTAKINGPPRPPNWRFDESDVGINIFGDQRGDYSMGFLPQQMMPQAPAPDPAETVVRSARALKELEQLWKKPDKDDDEKQRVSELEAELRLARQGGGGWGGGWGGPPPWAGGMPYRRDEEERRRREEDERRRVEEERRRAEEERRRTEEELRRVEERRRADEERRHEDEKRHAEELRRAEEDRRREDERKRELAEVRSQFERQMQELARSREEDKRRWEEERASRMEAERKAQEGIQALQAQREREEERRRYEDSRRDDKEKWEADRRRADEQFAEMRRQNELLAQKLERPQESTVDKLLGNLPQLMLQWQNMSASTRAEQLEAQRAAREDARAERDRAREDGTRQMQMWQEMSKMNIESIRVQSDQSQQYSRNLLELLGKNGSSDILNSVAGAMNMAVQAQTNALSAIAKSGLAGGGGPSPWVDVAAGAIEAAGGIASSIIASKMGVPPEAMRQMLGGAGGEGPQAGPPIRRPPQVQPPQQQRRLPPQQPPTRPAAVAAPSATAAPVRVSVPRQVPQQAQQQPQPQAEPQPAGPGLPKKLVDRAQAAAMEGQPPKVVARKLFALVETCDVNELHVGNPEAERIMAGLTNESKVPAMLREFFGMVGVEDEEYLEAIRVVYIKLIYAYVAALEDNEEEAGAEEGEETEGEEGEEAAGEEGDENPDEDAPEEAEAASEEAEAPKPVEEPPAAVEASPPAEAAPVKAPEVLPEAPKPHSGRPRRRIIPQPVAAPPAETPPPAPEAT